MNEPLAPLLDCLRLLIGVPGCLFLIVRGAYLLRGGALKVQSLEYQQLLTRTNMLNALNGLPPQVRLDERQLRLAGASYAVLGILGLAACMLWLYSRLK